MNRSIEDFRPRKKNTVKIFTCGPSIYQRPHLGNFRTFLYEDILVRYLKFKGFGVERSMNLTDIEDKTIKEAKRKNTDVKTLTNEALDFFKAGLVGLSIYPPEHLVPATDTVHEAVKMIQKLVRDGIAYEYRGDYFFDPLKIKNFGKLFRLDMSRWPSRKFRYKKDTYNGNRWNLGDFILWHSHKHDSGHPFWDTKIGKGRPSWNIQDPSVVTMTLGEQIDINCGGIDNIYRHHDYNIAVMEAYTKKDYSNYYLHGEHLVVNGKSMSKSAGNIIYPEDLLQKGFEWRDIRFFLIYKHYRKKLNYTENNFLNSIKLLEDFRNSILGIKTSSTSFNNEANNILKELKSNFSYQADNDLSVGNGFDYLKKAVKKIQGLSERTALSLKQNKELHGILKEIDNILKVIYPVVEK